MRTAPGGGLPLSKNRVARLAADVLRAEKVQDALISIAFVSDRTIAALNSRHVGQRGATDVLAFSLSSLAIPPAHRRARRSRVIGDIYIAPAVARKNAAEHGVAPSEEIRRLVIHGTLHVLGYDHPQGDGRTRSAMWRRQERLLKRLSQT